MATPFPWLRCGAAFAGVTLSLLAAASPASACSCAGALEPDVALANADVVFEGTPRSSAWLQADLDLEGYTGARRFDFEVARYYKGQLGSSLSIFTIDQESACGRDYAEEAYIIYARYTDSGYLFDAACSNSAPTAFAGGARAALGAGVAPDPSIPNEWLDSGEASGESAAGDGAAGDGADGVSSGIQRVPLAADEGARGCASFVGSRRGASSAWVVALGGVVAVALKMRRRSR